MMVASFVMDNGSEDTEQSADAEAQEGDPVSLEKESGEEDPLASADDVFAIVRGEADTQEDE
jgi:hypothetical protein